ncbi:MAG: phosphatidate cytidylyltransferase [Holosporales bacterium]|jgi:phosphatidate cytidylyltransferase|nr:phosphatidate cytidylyltransferase [Holosporales bacterium]
MENSLPLRMISAVITGALTIWIIIDGGFWLYLEISVCLLSLLREWCKINRNKGKTILFVGGIIYVTLPMLFWLWAAIYHQKAMIRLGLWVLTIVCTCDIFAFFGGKILEGPKLAPKISPNKTWSGVIIGATGALSASMLYLCFFCDQFGGINTTNIIISILITIAGILGDLLESKIKRILMVKDTGSIIPGHGGMCDRLDSFLLASYIFIIIDYVLKMGFIFG